VLSLAGVPDDLGFVHFAWDRAAQRREDAAGLASLAALDDARFLAFCGEVPVLRETGAGLDALFQAADIPLRPAGLEQVFLGLEDGAPRSALLLPPDARPALEATAGLVLMDLRTIGIKRPLPQPIISALGCAKALLGWHMKHRFCAHCGQPTEAICGGWKRLCTACGTEHFPRTDPVVIMLVTDGDRCLLGRSHRFPPGMYSCLAGFLEPGETIEDAVRREVLEEVGVRVGAVRIVANQPWPFPMSLMIGAIAEAQSTAITLDPAEIEDARWFSAADAAAMIDHTHPEGLTAPITMAIAHHIVRGYLAEVAAASG
jgi:NAD+ diphosphatase